MSKTKDRLGLAQFVAQWGKAASPLQEISDSELRSQNVLQDLLVLSPLFDQAIKAHKPLPTSGLIEWQECMRRWRETRSR